MNEKITVEELYEKAFESAKEQWPIDQNSMADPGLLMAQVAVWQAFAYGAAYGHQVLTEEPTQENLPLSEEDVEAQVAAFREALFGAPEADEPEVGR